MPRDLGDVLHYFLPTMEEDLTGSDERASSSGGKSSVPGTEASGRSLSASAAQPVGREREQPTALPMLALPVGARDVVRAALTWNLAIEIARLGGSVTLVTRLGPDTTLMWPEAGRGPLGAEVVHADASDLGALHRAALEVARGRAVDAREGGVVLVCVPPAWLRGAPDGAELPRWLLLFSTAEPRELMETYALAKPLLLGAHEPRVGVTIHGARRVGNAEHAFRRLADVASRHLGHTPVSYGLLVDDLHVYRAIVARRPIGLEHPQSPAARALRDVARLVLEDARKFAVV